MGRSADQTFYADYWSKIGYGYGHELRYVRGAPSRGTFRTYVFDVKGADGLDYDLDWNALQILPGKVKAAVNVRQYSDLLFQQQLPGRLQPRPRAAPSAGRGRSRRT